MDEHQIDQVLSEAEASLDRGETPDLKTFWKAVGEVKRRPELGERFADRIGRVDREAFQRWALLTLPLPVGTAAATAAGVGAGAVLAVARRGDDDRAGLGLLAGTGALLVSTHGLTHLVVGSALGIRFTHWFVGSLAWPAPGVKTDYATYLRTPARQRALMHASAPIVTKLIPFLVLALAGRAPRWSRRVLLALGLGQILTDALWSTSSSDWKKVRRELKYQ